MCASKTKKISLKKNSFLLLILIWLGTVLANDSQAATPDQTGYYTIAGFIGFTDRYNADFTLGAEFEYKAREQWSYGAVLEHTPDVFRSLDATVLMGTANFRPQTNDRLKLTGGAGIEFEDYANNDIRFRAGAAYDLILESSLTVTPRIAFDFGSGDESIVIGASFSRRF